MSEIEKQNNDFGLEWIYARYEDGMGVTEIAFELKKSESYVYAKMRRSLTKTGGFFFLSFLCALSDLFFLCGKIPFIQPTAGIV